MLKGQKTTDDEHIMEYLIKKLNITDMQAKFIINSNLKSLSIAYLNKYKQEAKELEQLYELQIKELNINIELKKKELSSKINKVNELYKKAIEMKSKK